MYPISYTRTGGAQAQFAFNGNAVAIYGTVSPYLAEYTVMTDGVTQSFQSGLASNTHTDVSTLVTLMPRANILITCRPPCWSVQLWFVPDSMIDSATVLYEQLDIWSTQSHTDGKSSAVWSVLCKRVTGYR